MIHALIPAGGRSERMGRPKLLLPARGKLVIERVIHALKSAKIDHILVVVAMHLPELAEAARRAGAFVLHLATPTPDMRATVELGLDWIEEMWNPQPDDHWLLLPADHPTLQASVITALETAQQMTNCSILIPTFASRRGHPTLVRWSHVVPFRKFSPDMGINSYFRLEAKAVLEVPVEDESVLWDLDTPEDYDRLLTRLE
jgi:molybdenum cofactor cytidylyltransferase